MGSSYSDIDIDNDSMEYSDWSHDDGMWFILMPISLLVILLVTLTGGK